MGGSSVDILYYLAFQQMRIKKEWLVLTNAPFVGFGGTKVYPIGGNYIALNDQRLPSKDH